MYAYIRRTATILITLTLFSVSAFAEGPARRVGSWAVLGPFSYGVDGYGESVVGDEEELHPVLGERVAGQVWRYFDDRYYCRNYDDYNDLYTYFLDGREGGPGGGDERQVAYCGTRVWSPAAQEVWLRFCARDRGKVWLNGSLVLEQPEVQRANRDTQIARIRLEAGWNTALVRVVNERRIWGFYFNLTDEAGEPVGGLEYGPESSEHDALAVLTPALPDGYNKQPYVWLDVRNAGGKFPGENPSASPFRLLASGGVPPYTWGVEGLPDGLSLDDEEGEFRGRTTKVGSHLLRITVTDSATPPNSATAERALRIKPRPTELWWETGTRLGSLRHHHSADETHWAFDHVEEQVDLLKRAGFDWQAYTAFSWWSLDPEGNMKVADSPAMRAYRDALRAAGIRFAQYMNFFDFKELSPDAASHAERMHEALERFMELNAPALWWFDLSIEGYGEPTEFDALYSLIRTLDPNCLITANNDIRARDYETGDIDILQVHGSFRTVSYWGHWPPAPLLRNNPKFMPVDSWRLPWKGYMDPGEWCKAIVTLLADPANLEAPRTMDLDTTPVLEGDYDMVALLRAVADWLEPRRDSILGAMPLDLPPADWGYAVRQPKTGDVYLHILSNPLGKRGLFERRFIDLSPLAGEILSVTRYPGGEALPFERKGERLSVDMAGVAQDEVDTIVRIEIQ